MTAQRLDPNDLKHGDVLTLQQEISNQWDTADDDYKADLFTIASGLYWYCSDNHGGQSTNEYSVMSTSDYKPGPLENGPDEESTYVYDQLTCFNN